MPSSSPVNMSVSRAPPGRCSERTRAGERLGREVQRGDLQRAAVAARGPSRARPCATRRARRSGSRWRSRERRRTSMIRAQPARERVRVGELLARACRRGCGRAASGPRACGSSTPRRSCAPRLSQRVSPSAIRSATSAASTVSIPARSQPAEREDARLQRVEHRQQQVHLLDPVALLGRDHARGRGCRAWRRSRSRSCRRCRSS